MSDAAVIGLVTVVVSACCCFLLAFWEDGPWF